MFVPYFSSFFLLDSFSIFSPIKFCIAFQLIKKTLIQISISTAKGTKIHRASSIVRKYTRERLLARNKPLLNCQWVHLVLKSQVSQSLSWFSKWATKAANQSPGLYQHPAQLSSWQQEQATRISKSHLLPQRLEQELSPAERLQQLHRPPNAS